MEITAPRICMETVMPFSCLYCE